MSTSDLYKDKHQFPATSLHNPTINQEATSLSLNSEAPAAGESGYSWLAFPSGRVWAARLLVTLLIIGMGGIFYVWYTYSGNEMAPASLAGLAYGVTATIFLLLAAVSYSLRRRRRKRLLGQLNASLNWHMCLAILALAFILMHSFGNFNLVSGTYTLFGMIALTLSGLLGRLLDRLLPRLIAGEVAKVLTVQGDDRITSISQKLQAIVTHNTQEKVRGFVLDDRADQATPPGRDTAGSHDTARSYEAPSNLPVPIQDSRFHGVPRIGNPLTLHTPWDLAYITLEQTQQELDRDQPHYRFIPDKKSALNQPAVLMPGAQEHISALQDVHSAMQREQLCRYLIRYWRVFHLSLAVVTLGLLTWHLIFAAQLLLPGIFHL